MSIVLLSGGLDSALNLALAARTGSAQLALTMCYGQRAESQELKSSKSLCDHYGVEWRSLDVRWLGEVNPTLLTRKGGCLPQLSLSELDFTSHNIPSMRAVWVANRNGIFLNIAAGFAEAMGLKKVYVGFNQEEAATFPDNSLEFLAASNKALSFSTLNGVEVDSFTKDLSKPEIMKRAIEMDLPLECVWSCYESGPARCWQCESCKRTERALLSQGAIGLEVLAKLGRTI